MGGSPTQSEPHYETATMMQRMEPLNLPKLKEETYFPAYKEKIPAPLTPAEKAQEAATYARLEKQGMSDDIDQEIIGAGKELFNMAKNKISSAMNPNAFGRDASTSLLSSQQAIESGLR